MRKVRSTRCSKNPERHDLQTQTSKEVAQLLAVSVKTVEMHRANIRKRLGCHSVSDLVV